ncbi:SDR family NAD(P)-dependent oxidoreductase [Duganella sp.]|uniref:SDR family NAD(P)-dependent oxidoreductase n=1 Tax=Duganella sp. TaxID=1904440 RepID=UPI0031D728FC
MLSKERVAIITGGAGINGLGYATARMMAAHGATVVILDLAPANPAAAALGPQHLGLAMDVTNKAQCEAAARATLERYGHIDVLFNNASITQPRKTLDISAIDYDAVLDVSLRGTLLMSQAVLPAMQKQQHGSSISTSSVSAQRGGGILGGPHYSAAKAGVLGLTRAMAREFGPDGIRVNAITPGLIATNIIKDKLTDDRKGEIAQDIPHLSAYCTGITLDVNGGMLIHQALRCRRHRRQIP